MVLVLVTLGCFGFDIRKGREAGGRRSYLWVRHAGDAGPVVRVEPHLDPLLARGRHVALHHARPLIAALL